MNRRQDTDLGVIYVVHLSASHSSTIIYVNNPRYWIGCFAYRLRQWIVRASRDGVRAIRDGLRAIKGQTAVWKTRVGK